MLLRLSLLLLLTLSQVTAQSKSLVNFEKQILPILEKNCVECHRATYTDDNGRKRRPKGKVMLDTLANIKKSKRGRLFVAKKVDDSLVIESITLAADDEDRMPPPKKGPPLKLKDVDLIKKWVEQGANYGSWTGETESTQKKATRSPNPTAKKTRRSSSKPKKSPAPSITLSKGLRPAKPATLQAFEGSSFQVQSIGDQNPLLYVSCCGKTDEVDDAALAALAPIADHIFELDLARSQVTDACCKQLTQMKRLVKLDLRQTGVGNSGVKELAACKELRTLNLFGTATGDYALTALASLKKLERLYLYETEASAKAVLRLRDAIPGIRIVTSVDLPDPMEQVEKTGRRRRR